MPGSNKPRFWLGFLIGTAVTIALASIAYLILRPQNNPIRIGKKEKPSEQSYETDSTGTRTDTLTIFRTRQDTSQRNDANDFLVSLSDSTTLKGEDSLYSAEFMLEDEPVNNLLQTSNIAHRRIMVGNHCTVKGAEPDYAYFDVEEWSDFVKNRTTYQLSKNRLIIKGLDIKKIEIIWDGSDYFIVHDHHNYRLSESDEFKRLVSE